MGRAEGEGAVVQGPDVAVVADLDGDRAGDVAELGDGPPAAVP
jgi:hypothetical protein